MTATGRLRIARAVALGGIGTCMVGTLLPWLRSGERARSSYQLAGLAGRVLDGPTATVAHAWLVFPMLAAAAIAALVTRPGRLVLALGALVAGIAGAFAIVVARAPLPSLIGLWVTVGGAGCALTSLVVAFGPNILSAPSPTPHPSPTPQPAPAGKNVMEQC